MGKRSTARRLAMQALYQADLSKIDIKEALDNIFETEKLIPATTAFAAELARSAWKNRETADQIITRFTRDWPLDRIGKVDKSILRLAIEELRSKHDPASVVIDEAVELAKKFSGSVSAKFINGILGSYLLELSKDR